MDKENHEQWSSEKKGSKFSSIFEALRLKHLILFLLCLLFLGILVSGGGNKKEPHRLAIKKKKHHNSQVAKKTKELTNTAVEKTNEGVKKVKSTTNELVEKTKKGVDDTTTAVKETASNIKEKAEETFENVKQNVDKRIGVDPSSTEDKKITDISSLSEDSENEVRDIAEINEENESSKKPGFFKKLFGEEKGTDCKAKDTTADKDVSKEKAAKTNKINTEDKESAKSDADKKKHSSKQTEPVETDKDNKVVSNNNASDDISKLEAEINSLKQQVKQLNLKLKNNDTQAEKKTKENDESIIDERIKFWQSMKEQANSF